MTSDDQSWVQELWLEVRPRAIEKVRVLVSAVQANGETGLTETQRVDSCRLAQQLAGSLGGYGFSEAASAAAELEEILASDPPIDQARAEAVAQRLSESLTE